MTQATEPQPSIEALMHQINAMKRRTNELEDQLFDACTALKAQKEFNLELAAQIALSQTSGDDIERNDSAAVQALLTHARLQGIEIGLFYRGQQGVTTAQVFEKAQSRGFFTRHTDKTINQAGKVSRYAIHSSDDPLDAIPEPDGDFVAFLDYDALKNDHHFLLQQYRNLCAAMSDKATRVKKFSPSLYLASGKKIPVVQTPKTPGKICFFYGRFQGTCDHHVTYGTGVPRCDRALVMNVFNARPMEFDYAQRRPTFGSSFLDELHARGYDIRTLRFSIERMQEQKI